MTGGRSLSSGAPELCVSKAELVLRNRRGACCIDLATGRTEFFASTPRLRGAIAAEPFATTSEREIKGAGRKPRWRSDAPQPGEACAVIVEKHIRWRIAVGEHHFALRVGIADSHTPVTKLGVRFRARFVAQFQQPSVLRVAYCGAHSQSDLSRSEVVLLPRDSHLHSWWTTAVFDASAEEGCVVGFLAARRFGGRVEISHKKLEAWHATENRQPVRGEVLWSEPIFFAVAERVVEALFDYGLHVGLANGRRRVASPIWGWGSWGHFHDAVTAPLALRNATELRRPGLRGTSLPLVHVDHGWEERFQAHRPMPTWQPRHEFGGDLTGLGRKLRVRGARLGVWVVPFAINSSGPLPRSLRAAILRDAEGRAQPVIGRDCYAVDPTSPAGERWLRELFGRLKRAGVTHYKLDFLRVLVATEPDDLHAGLQRPRRFHRRVTRFEAYRRGLEIIREVVGPKAHLLACGAPLLASAGLVDSVRIGSDITPEWETGRTGIRHCAENIRVNFFWHGRVWDNDADFLVVPRNPRMFRYWATAVAFSAGTALISADLPTLPAGRRRQLQRYFPAVQAAPRPLELGTRNDGVRIGCTVGCSEEIAHLVACFNRGDQPCSFAIDAAELGVSSGVECFAWDVLAERPLGGDGRRWKLRVEARDAHVVAIRQILDRPQFAGSSGHVASEVVELASVSWHELDRTLRIARRPERAWPERLFFRVPSGFVPLCRTGVRFVRKSELLTLHLRRILPLKDHVVLKFSHESSRQNSPR